jgi:hypothetical protein
MPGLSQASASSTFCGFPAFTALQGIASYAEAPGIKHNMHSALLNGRRRKYSALNSRLPTLF